MKPKVSLRMRVKLATGILVSKYLLSTYYSPGTSVRVVSKTDAALEVLEPWRKTD